MKEISARARSMGRKLVGIARKRGGQIAYYGGVALALTAIAFAAEQYRAKPDTDIAEPVLPAVELAAPAEVEEREDAIHAPEGAELLRAYSAKPEWNDALQLWESHEAVDYRLEGDMVASLSAGVVRTVGKSGVYGGFVEVECGAYLLRYASIAPSAGLAPGNALVMGDPIGRADASMPGEAASGAHLHLELMADGSCEDFAALTDGD